MSTANYSVTVNSSKSVKKSSPFEDIKHLFCFGAFFKKASFYTQKTIADKIIEPASIQEIKRIYTTPEEPLEKKTIDKFLHFFYCMPQNTLPMPHTNTFAMPGRPMFSQIKMSNGLTYLAAISEVGEINWFQSIDGKVSGFNPAEHTPEEIKQLADKKEIFPTGDLNRNYYKILLYPYHEDGKIQENDFLDIGLKKDAPLNSRTPVQLDDRLFDSRMTSFDVLKKRISVGNDSLPVGLEFPPHLLKVFKKLEEFYEAQKPTLGQMIYTLFSQKCVGTISPLSSNTPGIRFYNTKVVNPNITTKLSSKHQCEIPHPLVNGR